ncbi:MAG: hybrid sensor histidine kinase/response regulator, partial [Candidatus Kryptonium sp.]
DGFEVLRILKSSQETSEIPVIIVSANSEPRIIKRAFDSGATEFIAKPVNIEELLIRVSTVLKIKQTNDELKKLRSEFTYLLIQDLKNTISVIKASFELALKNRIHELSEDQKLILEIAETAINRHIKLLNEYLELSRLELNIDKISKEQIELDKIINDVVRRFKFAQNYNISVSFFADLPLQIHADKRKITRVFELILESILNVGSRDIEISAAEEESNYLIKIIDKATKIEKAETDYLFDKYKQALFQRLPKYNDLGLTISRIIVEAHSGKIWAEPIEGVGTAFLIKFPKG